MPKSFKLPETVKATTDSVYTNKPLTGLRGVWVCIEGIDANAEKDGLSQDQVRTDVELRLRKAGITVFDKMASVGNDSAAVLDISINTSKRDNGMYVYDISVELLELTHLIRSASSLAKATTWSTGSFGTVGTDNMPLSLRQTACDQVDKFANDYLAQNPK